MIFYVLLEGCCAVYVCTSLHYDPACFYEQTKEKLDHVCDFYPIGPVETQSPIPIQLVLGVSPWKQSKHCRPV